MVDDVQYVSETAADEMLMIANNGINTYLDIGKQITKAPKRRKAIIYPIIGPTQVTLELSSAITKQR